MIDLNNYWLCTIVAIRDHLFLINTPIRMYDWWSLGFIRCITNTHAYLVRKVLKEWHRILDTMEIGWNLKPSTEAVPLDPGCGVLVDFGIVEDFGDSCMCSIVHSRCLTAHVSRHIIHGDGWGKVEQNFWRKSWTVSWVSLEVKSSSFLSSPLICSAEAWMCAFCVVHDDCQSRVPTALTEMTLPLHAHPSAVLLLTRIQMCSGGAYLARKGGGVLGMCRVPNPWWLDPHLGCRPWGGSAWRRCPQLILKGAIPQWVCGICCPSLLRMRLLTQSRWVCWSRSPGCVLGAPLAIKLVAAISLDRHIRQRWFSTCRTIATRSVFWSWLNMPWDPKITGTATLRRPNRHWQFFL